MDRRLVSWMCIFCNTTKSCSRLDWMVLPCDHLICLSCFRRYKEFLKHRYECLCGERFDRSTYSILVETQQCAHDEENRSELDELD